LRAQGADLVVVPVPGKAAVYPERLAGGRPRAPRQGVLRNPGFGALVREMRAAGIRVFDTGPTLARAAAAGEEVFLRTDTRWSPAGMTVVARALAQFLAENVDLTESPLAVYHLGEAGLPNTGNLAAALGLPVGRALTEPEIVTTRPVLTDDGALWPPRHDARVLVLGDDLCAIYSDTALGWGEGAGLVEHLGYHLGRPVDGVAAAEGGLSAAWAKAGRERLAGKSVVVCVFADEALSSSGGTTSVSSAGGNP
jgi:alginate O-acetyltransferase complex protein AlgJ